MTEDLIKRAKEKNVIPLWPSNMLDICADTLELEEDNGHISNIRNPSLTVYSPHKDKDNGASVVVCPGGGYGFVSCINEGYKIAEWLNELGFKAYILKYRLPSTEGVNYRHPAPLRDVQRAIRLVRTSAEAENRDHNSVGIIGFSAGGHLAATALTQFDSPVDTEKQNCRPDFGMLIYPVINFHDDALCHAGSRDNLLGSDASMDQWIENSHELNVTPNTPPIFLAHARNDNGVPFNNSVVMHQALLDAGVPSEMHLYNEGGHGFGLGTPGKDNIQWPQKAAEWLKQWC